MEPQTITPTPTPAYAGFWRRAVGVTIDALILILLAKPIMDISLEPVTTWVMDMFKPFLSLSLMFIIIVIVVLTISFLLSLVYYTLLQPSRLQGTIGKYVVGIKITDLEGNRISYGKAFLRELYSILSAIVFGIGYIAAAFTQKKQTWHDMLAKTVVTVNKPRSGLVLFGILAATLVLGGITDRYLGAGFDFRATSTIKSDDGKTVIRTENGQPSEIVMKAADVDPILKKEVIAGYTVQKALIQTKDIPKIRAYVNDAAPAESRELLSKATDEEFAFFLDNYLKVINLTTEEMLVAPDSVWTFDADMSAVAIKSQVPGKDTLTTTVLVIKRDGVWR